MRNPASDMTSASSCPCPSKIYDYLPLLALLALAMTGFISIMTETLPAGLLPQISEGLGISQALAGQLVSAYALGSLVAAIPLTIATSGWPRKRVLLMTLLGFLVFNTITAFSSSYTLIMIARGLAGVAAGLAWSLIPGYARLMVSPDLRGRALAVAMVGTPIALALGVPIGTWMGSLIGWRMTFGVMSLLSMVMIAWVVLWVPDYPGQKVTEKLPLGKVFRTAGVRPVLAVSVLWMLAHNVLYTYIAPFVAPAGLASQVDVVLLVLGGAAILGIFITGKIVDHHLRNGVLISLIAFGVSAIILASMWQSAVMIYIGLVVWGITFGGAATLLQTALADAAGDGADVALSMSVVAWNVAIALGSLLGGVVMSSAGAAVLPWIMLLLVLVALVIAFTARRHGFVA